jgi:hypothetical protein
LPNVYNPKNSFRDFLSPDLNCLKAIEAIVFDRWGNALTKSNNVTDSWEQAKNWPNGVLVLYLKYVKQDGTTGTVAKSFAVIR